ncbi:hypothetical protein EPI10_019250 [Gossypium australe]|uniref:Uncharacterized protein n=1 Tax=Gossypium australe TaxID=47621 RepID=A0A5B6UHM0_9ROSI|nr:hypothetical protein EPI10_019250 [Gossypium australe]
MFEGVKPKLRPPSLEVKRERVRIAARFHSHCPQTARLYYHPPPNSEAHPNPDANHSTPMAKVAMSLDSTHFIFYSVL